MAVVTYGFHRTNNVTQRMEYGLTQQVVPGATIFVTVTSSGAGATIYSDPGMSITIPGSLITADQFGWYEYYIPLGYNVTETISSTSGLLVTVTNVVQNGPVVASLTTTSATSDTVSIPGFVATGHVSLTATNATAAAMIASVYVSAKAANSITVSHPITSGGTFDIVATPY
jgi:hypothetical protein